jgi:hypothetical protein
VGCHGNALGTEGGGWLPWKPPEIGLGCGPPRQLRRHLFIFTANKCSARFSLFFQRKQVFHYWKTLKRFHSNLIAINRLTHEFIEFFNEIVANLPQFHQNKLPSNPKDLINLIKLAQRFFKSN